MIIATPDGSFFSEGWSERDKYERRLTKVSRKYAEHLCERSQDYIVFRPLTLREKIHRLATKARSE